MLRYTSPRSDSFLDENISGVPSNIGRPRSNALLLKLSDASARSGHGPSMAQHYQEARDTIQLQNLAASRKALLRENSRPILSTFSTPKRLQPAGELRPQTDSKIPMFRSPSELSPKKPSPDPVKQRPRLPDWAPVGRLSDDMPPELRPKLSFQVKVKPSRGPRSITPPHVRHGGRRISPVPSGRIIRRRDRPLSHEKYLDDIPPSLRREDAFSRDVQDDAQDGFEPESCIPTPLPQTEPFVSPQAKRVATWLECVDPASPPEEERVLDDRENTPFSAGIRTPSSTSASSSKSMFSKTIGSLICVPPPLHPRKTYQTLSTPAKHPKRMKIPARNWSRTLSDPFVTTPSGSTATTSAPSGDPVKTPTHTPQDDSNVVNVADAIERLELPTLSPNVEVFRKGERPKKGNRERADSYFDDDIFADAEEKAEMISTEHS
jgi:hypothetical protein